MSEKVLHGKVALVTGAASGIGRASAVALAHAGARVALADRHQPEGDSVAAQINDAGGEAFFLRTDVTEQADIDALVAQTRSRFGALHIAFNNAGVEGAGIVPLAEDSVENLDTILDVNVRAVWRSLKAQIPAIAESGGGSIINNSSVAGHKGFAGLSAYCASKHAVEGLTRSVALEVATSRIRVNAVAPGPILTPMLDRITAHDPSGFAAMTALKRAGAPDEIAATVVFLASDAASYITGQSIVVDGGMLA